MDIYFTTRRTFISRLQSGNGDEQWEEFNKLYHPFILSVLGRLNFYSCETDDLVQAVMIQLWKSIQRYDVERGKFRTWVATVVRNTAINEFDKKQRRKLPIEDSSPDQLLVSSPLSDFEKIVEEEWGEFVSKYTLEQLGKIFTGKAIEAFIMSREDMSIEDISRKLEITPGSCRVLISRVRTKFLKEAKRILRESNFE